jgi:sulfatase modifying factor 1
MNTKSIARTGSQSAVAELAQPTDPGMVWIPGGSFQMGSEKFYPEERPAHKVTVDGFWMDRCTVTNEQWEFFVDETRYVTLAERVPDPADFPGATPELLVAASVVFTQPNGPVDLSSCSNWWTYVQGASWRHPMGPSSSLRGLEKHPVVHIAYDDAHAYAKWAGKELPTEAEWEFAARGSLANADYEWGNELNPGGRFMANTWQGEFPWQNLNGDGFEGTAPVGSFPANGYGLFDMTGNVWEWTEDWYQDHIQQSCCGNINPQGGRMEKSYDPLLPNVRVPRKVMKGGSFLCAPNYSQRYRPAARMAQPIDTSMCHLGFRCITRETNSAI